MEFASSRVSAATVAAAQAALRQCKLCPRACGVDRTQSKHGAFCRLDSRAWVYRELLSVGEEPAISPTWLVDLGGCSLRCLFCSEWEHVVHPRASPATELDAAWFVPRLRARRLAGARTLSFVGGDPTVSAPAVLATLAQIPDADWLPVVWNCNGWLSQQTRDWLAPVVDTWLVDVKFGHPDCARRLAGVPGEQYLRDVLDFVDWARPRGLMLRHLVMPGHGKCCTEPVLAWHWREMPDVPMNVMHHYQALGPMKP